MSDTSEPTLLNDQYAFVLDENTGRLFGVIKAANTDSTDIPNSTPSLHAIKQDLRQRGYMEFFFPTNSLEQFYKKLVRSDTGNYLLAERRDAKLAITVAADKTTARAQTDQAWGGQPLTEETIMAEVHKAGVAPATLDQEKLKLLISTHSAADLIIANAKPPTDGVNAKLVPLLESKRLIFHDADSDQAIDQHEIFDFLVVEPGDALIRRTPATPGENGMDVLGKPVKAKPGKNIPFEKPFKGVAISDDDENLLVAAIKGHPVFNKLGAQVDPIMAVNAVDIHSGNIEYDGSLLVKNNIEAGYSVSVSGDILVKGAIVRAHVSAGGNIDVSRGVTGDEIQGDEFSCTLEAGGNVSAKFFQHSKITSQGDVNVHEYIMQCRVKTEGFINAGQSRGRGCIIGGHAISNAGINAKVLGSEAYLTTYLELGNDSEVYVKFDTLNQQLEKRLLEESQLERILLKIRKSGKPTNVGETILDKARKIENTLVILRAKIDDLKTTLAEMKPRARVSDNLAVNISGNVFPNVVIRINGKSWTNEELQRRIQVKLDDNHISHGPLPH